VVPRASAVVPGAADTEPIVIHADHINMVKVASKEDNGYRTVSGHLRIFFREHAKANYPGRVVSRSVVVVAKRLARDVEVEAEAGKRHRR
jgi:hypothetical protein